MSRQLPPRPNLEHLRKQAKDLLERLQQQEASTQLADAQHTLAREYGFASWPQLKAHVEASGPISPFTGRWKANLSKSRRHPANPFQSAIVDFQVSADSVVMTDTVVDASGREERRVNTIRVDGGEHPSEHGNGYTLIASWCGSHAFETVAMKEGETVGKGTYRVSDDGKTLTVEGDELSIVFDRISTELPGSSDRPID
jgi:hypothetical protein